MAGQAQRVLDAEFVLDDQARRRLTDRFGAAAEQWCDELPVLAGRCCARWGLDLDTAISGGTSRLFAARQRTGRRVVLKLTPARPSPPAKPVHCGPGQPSRRRWTCWTPISMPGRCCWKN
jgi:hypothetical protein